jgi:hypothetical protein
MKDDTGAVVAMFYLDDGLVAAPIAEKADALVNKIGNFFEIRKLGEPIDYLGINIHGNEETGTITIDQEDKARAIAEEFGNNWGSQQSNSHSNVSRHVYGTSKEAK